MNSQKTIDINQSSLLGLKAELLRKKSEASTAKYAQQINAPKVTSKKFLTKLDKSNEGVAERDRRDAEEIQEESDELKKSQKVLEAKAKLYDKLVSNPSGGSSTLDSASFLVDFKQKSENEGVVLREKNEGNNDLESDLIDENEEVEEYGEYSDEDEWVDFVDCLGRTKRCHRDDLEVMKKKDEDLRKSLHSDGGKSKEKEKDKETQEFQLPQLCSEDMKREILRQKWEEQERQLLDKKNVHYQDILFDEARTHGVGYYSFSTDEAERARQQEELKKLRRETVKQQAETQTAAQRKQKLMAERLKAARRRKRERLGLPPEEDEVEEEQEEEEVKPESPKPEQEVKKYLRKAAPIRPWDIGKDNTGTRILSQDEWIEKKREERIEEFAPLPVSRPEKKSKGKRYFETYKKEKSFSMDPVPIEDELEDATKDVRGRGVEIAPPPTFEMYGPSSKPKRNFTHFNSSAVDKSIEEGLNFLRRQVEEKQSKKSRRDDEIEIL